MTNTTRLKPHRLHIESIKYVKAKAQADLLNKIMDFLELFMKNKSNDKNFLDKCNFQKILNKIIQISKEKKLIIIDEKIKKILSLNENNTTN